MMSSAIVQSAIVLMNRRIKAERDPATAGFVPVCSRVTGMHLHHPQGTIRAQAQTNRALAMRLRWDRRNGSVLLRRLPWTRRSSLVCRRRSWRSSRRRRICGTARHERSRQLKLSYALSFSLKFFHLTLTLLLYFALLFSTQL